MVCQIWPTGYCLLILVYTISTPRNLLERIIWTLTAPIQIPFERSEFRKYNPKTILSVHSSTNFRFYLWVKFTYWKNINLDQLSSTLNRISFTELNFNTVLSPFISGHYKIKLFYCSVCTCKTSVVENILEQITQCSCICSSARTFRIQH